MVSLPRAFVRVSLGISLLGGLALLGPLAKTASAETERPRCRNSLCTSTSGCSYNLGTGCSFDDGGTTCTISNCAR
jgi:hypothetical protein